MFDYVNRQKNYKADRRSTAKLSLNQSRGAPLRLREHLSLPLAAIGALLGADRTSIGHAITITRTLIAGHGILVPPAAPPPAVTPRTPAGLREHAAAAGITLEIPQNGQVMPEHFKPRRREPQHART